MNKLTDQDYKLKIYEEVRRIIHSEFHISNIPEMCIVDLHARTAKGKNKIKEEYNEKSLNKDISRKISAAFSHGNGNANVWRVLVHEDYSNLYIVKFRRKREKEIEYIYNYEQFLQKELMLALLTLCVTKNVLYHELWSSFFQDLDLFNKDKDDNYQILIQNNKEILEILSDNSLIKNVHNKIDNYLSLTVLSEDDYHLLRILCTNTSFKFIMNYKEMRTKVIEALIFGGFNIKTFKKVAPLNSNEQDRWINAWYNYRVFGKKYEII